MFTQKWAITRPPARQPTRPPTRPRTRRATHSAGSGPARERRAVHSPAGMVRPTRAEPSPAGERLRLQRERPGPTGPDLRRPHLHQALTSADRGLAGPRRAAPDPDTLVRLHVKGGRGAIGPARPQRDGERKVGGPGGAHHRPGEPGHYQRRHALQDLLLGPTARPRERNPRPARADRRRRVDRCRHSGLGIRQNYHHALPPPTPLSPAPAAAAAAAAAAASPPPRPDHGARVRGKRAGAAISEGLAARDSDLDLPAGHQE